MITNIHLCAALPIACELERCCLEGAHPEGEDVDGRGEGHRVLWIIRGCTVAIVFPSRANHLADSLRQFGGLFHQAGSAWTRNCALLRLREIQKLCLQPASQTDISSLVGTRELST